MSALLTLQGATAMAAAETILIMRFCPERLWFTTSGGTRALQLMEALFMAFSLNYCLLFLYSRFLYPNFLSPLRNVPRPKWYFFRMIYMRFVKQAHHGAFLLRMAENTRNGGLLLLNEGLQDRIFAVSIPVAAEILVRKPYDFIKPENVRDFMSHFLGDGLIISEGERHKWLRKHSQTPFNYRHIKDLYPMMWQKALALQVAMEDEIKQQERAQVLDNKTSVPFEMCSWAAKVTFDVIGIAGLGRDFNLMSNAEDQLVNDYEGVTGDHMLLYFVMSMWLSFELVQLLPWRKNKYFMEKTTSLKRICNQLICDKRSKILVNGDNHFDILALLIKSGDFSDDELGGQLLTYIVAGHDTASATLSWACFLLAQNPKWQRQLRDEVRQAKLSGPNSSDVQNEVASVLEGLPILNGVLNETLRLYPTVPVTTRVAARDTSLGSYIIPKGTEILLSPWAINRSMEHWGADAELFNPNRWIDNGKPNNSGGAESNYAFMTFLHGPRSCIGQGFAKAELRCLLAAIVSKFEWTLATDEAKVVPVGAITIRPYNGLHLDMKLAS